MKVSKEVLSVLSAADLSGDSLVLKGQLDRKMYAAVNKVLEAAGWQWNRKAKAHTCQGDAVDVLEQVLLTGEVTVAKNEFGEFFTPPALAAIAVQRAEVSPGMIVLEPSAGHGAIVKALLAIRARVTCVEIQEKSASLLSNLSSDIHVLRGDFLKVASLSGKFDRIVMNPPFARQADIKHVMHALKFLAPNGRLVSIMSNGVTFREDALTREFRSIVESRNGVIEALPEGSFKSSGTMVNTVLVSM